MISIRKQLFALMLCTGFITIVLIGTSVNLTIRKQFENYIELNIQKTSTAIVERLAEVYEESSSWEDTSFDKLSAQTQVGNFSIAVLDTNKELVWGMTERELLQKIEGIDYPPFYSKLWHNLEKMIYTFEDMPIMTPEGLIGYARIGYFPSFLLATDDVLFQHNINKSILVSGVAGLVCFVFIGTYITALFTKPVYALAHTSANLAEGRYKVRYKKVSRIKELENLRHSMNYLAQKLDQQDTLRRKLISDVSHEIRTPLHILQSNLEAMIDGIYPIDEDQMQVLYQEVLRFGSLLNNLDKLKNIEEDILETKLEELHINTCIKDVFNAFKIVARERGIKYRLNSQATDQVVIMGDHSAMKQILMNIFSNAFKFTTLGAISVTTEVKGKMMRIKVEDTGIGIAKEDLPYIFERMYRGDKSREQFEGSGIGLTIVKKLIMQHEGKIEIVSEEGKGTCVMIDLPIHHTHKANMLKVLTLKE